MRIITTALIAALALTACGTTDLPDQEWFEAMEDTAADTDMEDTAMEDTADFLLEGEAMPFSIKSTNENAEVHVVVVRSGDSDFGTSDDLWSGHEDCSVADPDCMVKLAAGNDPNDPHGIMLNGDFVEAFHHVAAIHNTSDTDVITVIVEMETAFGAPQNDQGLTIQPGDTMCAGVVNPCTEQWVLCTGDWADWNIIIAE